LANVHRSDFENNTRGAPSASRELMLRSERFNVYTTDLGEEGIDLGKLYDYDIILLDLNLPDMSGFEVLRSLRVSKVKTPILNSFRSRRHQGQV
jgi:two-component system cell cycle response regulator CtrA